LGDLPGVFLQRVPPLPDQRDRAVVPERHHADGESLRVHDAVRAGMAVGPNHVVAADTEPGSPIDGTRRQPLPGIPRHAPHRTGIDARRDRIPVNFGRLRALTFGKLALKIGFAAEWIGEQVGGLERYAASLVRALVALGEPEQLELFLTPRGAET